MLAFKTLNSALLLVFIFLYSHIDDLSLKLWNYWDGKCAADHVATYLFQ
jgi:hypothetical protein